MIRIYNDHQAGTIQTVNAKQTTSIPLFRFGGECIKNHDFAETNAEVIIMAYQLFASRSPEEIRNMRNYFNTLPPYVQENFMQSGLQMHSEEEMRACAEKLMNSSDR